MTIKDKLVECVAINMAKERYRDSSKKDEFYIEAEQLLKTLILRVLVEKKNGDPLQYIEMLENIEQIFDLDYYDVWFLESTIFGEWSIEVEIFNTSLLFLSLC